MERNEYSKAILEKYKDIYLQCTVLGISAQVVMKWTGTETTSVVFYVDTEQSPYHCLKVMKRILDNSKVCALHIRAMDFEPFAFHINDDALSEQTEGYRFESRKIGRPHKDRFDPGQNIREQ